MFSYSWESILRCLHESSNPNNSFNQQFYKLISPEVLKLHILCSTQIFEHLVLLYTAAMQLFSVILSNLKNLTIPCGTHTHTYTTPSFRLLENRPTFPSSFPSSSAKRKKSTPPPPDESRVSACAGHSPPLAASRSLSHIDLFSVLPSSS